MTQLQHALTVVSNLPTTAQLDATHQQLRAVWQESPNGVDVARPPYAAPVDGVADVAATARARTSGGDVAAAWLGRHGDDADGTLWPDLFRHWADSAKLTKQQTVTAQALFGRIHRGTVALTEAGKDLYVSPRPFVVDQSISVVGKRPGHVDASYPSSHASGSFSDSTTMQLLDPDHAAQYQTVAEGIGLSREYGGAHRGEDILAGARLGHDSAIEGVRALVAAATGQTLAAVSQRPLPTGPALLDTVAPVLAVR
jgi:hypothetical protein